MKLGYLIVGGIGFIVGWNIFLIQRDQQMLDTYYNQPSAQQK